MKNFKKNKGITLIALVITVVVLLILAGVAIGVLGGENGLIMRTQQAKKETRYKEAKEKINLELMGIQADCTEQRKEYNVKEIALKMKESKEITINKTYNKEIASISEGIQIHPENIEAIVVSVDKYSEYKFLIGESTKIEGVIETEKVDTVAKSDFIELEIFEKSLLKSIAKQSSIEFSYQVKEIVQYKAKVSIHIQDKENGIAKIEFPDGTIECFGRTEYAKDNCEVEIGVEYKVKITSKSGETKEETIYIEPEIEVTEPIIGTANPPTSSVADNSQTKGTTLYINFSATLKGTDCTITLKDDTSKTVPYAITTNGKYIFIATGICNGKTITKEIEVFVNKYQSAQNLVQYDAGDWTEEEIQSLQTAGLYNLNASCSASNTSGLNFTFGGFTNKESSDATNSNIITSRNKSVKIGWNNCVPKYDGWQILEIKDSSGNIITYETEINNKLNNLNNEKVYVTKIVHAGCPENFVHYFTQDSDGYSSEYILSSGLRQQNFNTYSPRSWQMYVDKSQKDLIADTIDKDGNSIKDIHAMTEGEARAITEINGYGTKGIRNTGSCYWLASFRKYWNRAYLYFVDTEGKLGYGDGYCLGVRPIVSLKDGVYIKSGYGTEESPYVLAIEE